MTPYLSLSSSSFLTSISCRKLHGILLASYPHITSFDRLRTGIPTKDKIMAEALQGVYRPRRPQTTSFYQLVEDYGEHLKNVYPDRYERQFGYYRPITEKVFFKYLDCGILRHGFARILSPSVIMEIFQHKVFRMLLKEGLITEERVRLILSWRDTGFHIHNKGKVV